MILMFKFGSSMTDDRHINTPPSMNEWVVGARRSGGRTTCKKMLDERAAGAVDDEEHRRQKKLEEALEVQSLRRIITAYLNYPEAAEDDVKRYERSYRKLSPAHKEFEPPLDMSQDVDCCDDLHAEHASDHCCPSKQSNCCSSPTPAGGTTCCSIPEEVCHEEGSHMHKMSTGLTTSEETAIGGSHDCTVLNGQDGTEKETSTVQLESDILECNGNDTPHECSDPSFQFNVPLVDVDKVRCIVRNIVRDWAAEGQKERDECYNPILEELDSQFPNRSRESPPACLVPGAGLGRLALEISRLGFVSQGNEFSYYMMICSSFILNNAEAAGEWTIYPWIHSNCNSLSDSDQLRPVSIPDIHPASAGITKGFSMCGGDFVEVYSDPSQAGCWDAVVTCFFIDTAHNIVEYIETISKILKDGGVWINLGPLLYHFADMYGQEDEMSIELSLEDVKRVALHYGFEFEDVRCFLTFCLCAFFLLQNHYFSAFWTARKVTKTT
ncbi:Carnosine N-methyltransferase [Linum perenne]